jgi:putative ABC transport system permease protein
MRDWQTYVRDRLALPDHAPERHGRIVRELAAQLEDFYRDAIARGLPADEADAFARAQVTDWPKLSADLAHADRPHAQPRLVRVADRIAPPAGASLFFPRWFMANLLRDARYALRQLVRTPGFTTVAVLTLALGVGATTAIFSVVNGVLLRPLPFADPDALVRVHEVVPQYGRFSVAPATFIDWRAQNRVFERTAAYSSTSGTFTDAEVPERIPGAVVTWDTFELLGIAPVAGGGFSAAHEPPGAPAVMVLSHGLWQRRFGGNAAVIGQSIPVNGVPTTILGVMPPDFYFPSRMAEFWQPMTINPSNAPRGAHFLGAVARLKPGVTLAQANAEMKGISERLAVEYPDNSANESSEVVPLLEQVVGSVRTPLMILLAAVGVVVLIACANVANLLLVRASVREREIAIRSALGAGRRRIVVQMLAESLVLAVVGGGLGLLLAYLAIPSIQTLSAGGIPRVAEVAIDGRVLGFAAVASILTGLLFGLAPAWHAARSGLGLVLKEGGRSSVASGSRWVRSALLVGEVALSIVLLVGASLLLRSFARVTSVDPGFQPDGLLAFQVSLPQSAYGQDGNRITFYHQLLERIDALPGVSSAAMVQTLPMRGGYVLSFEVQGRPKPEPGQEPSANYRVVSPDYFAALGVPVRRGRALTAQDATGAQLVAVVDEAFVRKHFPDEDPIGRGIDIGNGVDGFFQIVGVVGDVRHAGLDSVAAPTMYVPYEKDVFSTMWILARAEGDVTRLAGPVRDAVRALDRSLPAYSILPFTTVMGESVAQRRFSMLLLGGFAGLALFLAAVGLYGVVAYSVSQRTREIGLRMAVGADRRDILRLIVGGGMKLAVAGVAIGLAAAVGVATWLASQLESMLFETTTSDVMSYAATAGLLLAVAALACYLPARRAMRVDPLVALQAE